MGEGVPLISRGMRQYFRGNNVPAGSASPPRRGHHLDSASALNRISRAAKGHLVLLAVPSRDNALPRFGYI